MERKAPGYCVWTENQGEEVTVTTVAVLGLTSSMEGGDIAKGLIAKR